MDSLKITIDDIRAERHGTRCGGLIVGDRTPDADLTSRAKKRWWCRACARDAFTVGEQVVG